MMMYDRACVYLLHFGEQDGQNSESPSLQWKCNDFCIIVDNEWRDVNGFRLIEIDSSRTSIDSLTIGNESVFERFTDYQSYANV